MKRSQPYNCGIGPAFEIIGGKWKALILYELHGKRVRTGELRRLLGGITEKMLIQQLREMEADGIVRRDVFPEVPPRVEYSATAAGEELNRALGPVAQWGQKYAAARTRTSEQSS
jgi:DNA-binding HxlR family transcriptional regulator